MVLRVATRATHCVLITAVLTFAAAGMARPAHAQVAQQGIDVSSYQGTIAWSAVAASGISFTYIRAVVGQGTDSKFQSNWDGARGAGINAGAYLYFKPGEDPNVQASMLIQQLQSVTFGSGSLVPAIDIEETDGLSEGAVDSNLHTLVNDISVAIGALPAIYAAPSWWDGNVGSADFTADPLWVANWCGGCAAPGLPASGWGGFGWQAWQYTSNGSVPGISGNVDQDVGNPGPPLFQGATTSAINGPVNAPDGAPVTLAATVTPPSASGSFTFTENGSAITGCSHVALGPGGGATCHTTSLATGNQRVAAQYSTGSGYFSSAAGYTIAVQNIAWPATAGSPTSIAEFGQQLTFWRGTDNNLYESWYSSGATSGPVDWTAAWGGVGLLGSAPALMIAPGNQLLVFWQGTNGQLWEAWYTWGSGWNGPVDFTAALGGSTLASAPSLLLTPTGQQLVFWRGTDSHLWEAWFTPGLGWLGPVDYSAHLGGAGPLASAPATMMAPGGQVLVFWQGTNGHLWEAWFTPGVGWLGPVDYTTLLGGQGALSSAPTALMAPGEQQLVFWQGTNDHLWEAWFTPGAGWSGPVDFTTQLGGSGPLTSEPAVAMTPGNQQIAFWQGSNDHVWEAWFTPGYGWAGPVDWTAAWAAGDGVLSAPSLEAASANGQQLLFWQGPNNHLEESLFAGAWSGPFDWTAG